MSSSSSSNAVPKPIGVVDRTSGEGSQRKNHYKALTFFGKTYELEDTVLIGDVSKPMKPYVAMIRDITTMEDGKLMVSVQRFYRPEDVDNKNRNVEMIGARELYYSFHKNEVPAECIVHKCKVHFIPTENNILNRRQHPGFIVQKMYDPNSKKLLKLNDEIYIQYLKDEIDQLIDKTACRLGIIRDNLGGNHAAADEEMTKE